MKLTQLLGAIEIIESHNFIDLEINHISCNSKKVLNSDLFVCIKGYQTDGHKYIKDAVTNGAVALIVEDYQKEWDLPQFVVVDSRKALAAIADTFYDHPSEALKVIGITATNGKTTTSYMVNDILERHGLKTGLIGTVAIKYGDFLEASYLTTPESLDLHRIFYDMKKKDISHVCMEVSSSALELNRVGNVSFDIVTLNNISPEHIDLHGSFDNYYAAKSSLIKDAKPHQWVLLNLDDEYSSRLKSETKGKVITYGIKDQTGDFCCKNIDISTGRAKFTVEIMKPLTVGDHTYEKCNFDIELRTPGYHSVYNSIVAIIIGLLCEVPIETIQKSLRTFGGVERRFEIVYEDDFMIIDDHFANSANITSTFLTLQKMDYKKLKMVYAIRGSRGITVIRESAETVVEWSKKLGVKEVITSLSKSHVTWKDEVIQEEIEVFNKIMADAGIKVKEYEELNEAIADGLNKMYKGDVLLLAGCQGMDYGARLALEHIHKLNPSIDKDILFEPLERRVIEIVNLEDKNER